MKKFFKKFSQNEWRRIVKSALVCALVLAAVAVTYGYYLVDKMSSEYNQAQLVSLQDEEPPVLSNNDEDEQNVKAEPEDKTTVPTIAAANELEEEQEQSQAFEEEKQTAASKPVEIVQEPAEPEVSYEAVGAIASVNDAPCSVEETYAYGYGYDPIYNDIRFHNHALYQAEASFAVLAVADGVVEKCQTTEEGTEITIKHQWGLSVYASVDECLVKEGDKVTKGQIIANTCALKYSLWQAK